MRLSRAEETKLKMAHREKLKQDKEIEKLSRNLKCINVLVQCHFGMLLILVLLLISVNVDTDRVKRDWFESEGQFQIKSIAQYYGIYEHLFGYAYFVPKINLDIKVKRRQSSFVSDNRIKKLFLFVCLKSM